MCGITSLFSGVLKISLSVCLWNKNGTFSFCLFILMQRIFCHATKHILKASRQCSEITPHIMIQCFIKWVYQVEKKSHDERFQTALAILVDSYEVCLPVFPAIFSNQYLNFFVFLHWRKDLNSDILFFFLLKTE